MTLDEAFAEIHNLSVREALRRFQPEYSVVVVSTSGEIQDIVKYKIVPEFSEIGELIKQNEGSGAFIASAKMYPTVDEFRGKVEAITLTLQKRAKDNPPKRSGLVGKTYYAGNSKD